MWRDVQGVKNWNGMIDSINPILKAEMVRYVNFAQQWYDSFENSPSSTYYRKCKHSKNSLAQRLELLNYGRGYEVTKYIYANMSLLDSISGEELSKGMAWMGYIVICNARDEIKRLGRHDIVVAWRGTKTSFEWMQNLRDILVPMMTSKATTCSKIQTISNPDVRIEKGFLSCYTSTDEDSVRCTISARGIVMGEITRLVKECKEKGEEELHITFTGHSLGAALATLSAYDIKEAMVKEYGLTSILITVSSFVSPRVWNLSIAQHLAEIGVKVLRVVNHRDLVPKIPGIFFNEKLG